MKTIILATLLISQAVFAKETLTSDQAEKKVREMISQRFAITEDSIKLESTLKKDIGVEDLDMFEILSDLSDKYERPVLKDEASMVTVGDIVRGLSQEEKKPADDNT